MNSQIPIHLAVEDELSRAVLKRLLVDSSGGYYVGAVYGLSGFGYLKQKVRAFNRAAQVTPFLLLTDLDRGECAPVLIRAWMGGVSVHPNLLFRVAVRSVESWLLADGDSLARFLRVRRAVVPSDPEALDYPKRALVDLARRSTYSVMRKDLAPPPRGTAAVGRNYTGRLIEFVNTAWKPSQARRISDSLDRTIRAIESFAPSWDQ